MPFCYNHTLLSYYIGVCGAYFLLKVKAYNWLIQHNLFDKSQYSFLVIINGDVKVLLSFVTYFENYVKEK